MQGLKPSAYSEEDPGRQKHQRVSKYVAEFIGTFFLVFTIGCNIHTGSVGAAISIGVMLMVMVYALGPVSGGHFNPAVTLAVYISGRKKLKPFDAVMYMVMQLLGGVTGALMYWAVVDRAFLVKPVSVYYSTSDAVACEILYTFALCYVVLNVATTEAPQLPNCPNNYFGFAIGLTVTSAAIAVGPVSGCCLNPAVSAASMIAAYLAHGPKAFHFWWPYNLAPFAGAIIAFLFFYLVRERYEYAALGEGTVKKKENSAGAAAAKQPESFSVATRAAAVVTRNLKKHDTVELKSLGEQIMDNNLFVGLRWEVSQRAGMVVGVDIDAACVKFDRDGESKGAVYFAERKDHENGIEYSGDNLVGSEGEKGGDNETIKFKLSQIRPEIHYLFLCMTIFSSGVTSFKDVKHCTARLVDMDDGNREILKYTKQDMGKEKGNALVLAMIHRVGKEWYFKAMDECYEIQAHGTYRAILPKLKTYCKQTAEVVGGDGEAA